MRNLAIIPARSGSKGLPDKNVRLLAGKPLLAYSVEAALRSGVFAAVMVSTDSEAYAEIAREAGAEVPFLRSKEHSLDTSSSWDAVREVLSIYVSRGIEFDTVALLQPTSPFRSPKDIVGAYRMFDERRADAVTGVTETAFPVQQCFPLSEDGSMEAFGRSSYRNARRQELEPYYQENGAVYIARVSRLRDPAWDFYEKNCYAYRMPQERSLDIDGLMEFRFAEFLLENNGTYRENE